MRQHNANRLEEEPIGGLLLSFSLPAIVSTTIVSIYNIVSSIFIGQSEGALAITGLAITFPFMNLVLAVCMMVAIGGATVCSIELGAKRMERAAAVLGNGILLTLVLSCLFALVCLPLLDPILVMFGASGDTLPYARDYMEIILWGAPIGSLMILLNHIMRASGYPARSMYMSLISVGLNLVLTPLFIFWCGWGIRGAAVATVLSQLASLLIMLAHFCSGNSVVRFQPGIFTPRKAILASMMRIGLSPFLMNACACLVIIVINLSLRHYGGDLSIGAYGIANRLLLLFAMIVFGLTQGMQPLVGYNFGAGRMDRVRKVLWYGVAAATLVTTTGFVTFQFFARPLAGMFTNHQELIDMAVAGMRLCSLLFFLVGGQIVIAAYFQSMGKASIAIFLSLSRQLLFLIPGLLLLPRVIGVSGVWLSLPMADLFAFLVSVFILRRAR